VEGFEREVLAGMQRVFGSRKPELLTNIGYSIYHVKLEGNVNLRTCSNISGGHIYCK